MIGLYDFVLERKRLILEKDYLIVNCL